MRTFGCKPPLPPPAVFFKRFEMTHISCVRAPRVPNALAAVELELLLSFEVAGSTFREGKAHTGATNTAPSVPHCLRKYTTDGTKTNILAAPSNFYMRVQASDRLPRTNDFLSCHFLSMFSVVQWQQNVSRKSSKSTIFVQHFQQPKISSRLLVLFDRPLHMGENCLYCTI